MSEQENRKLEVWCVEYPNEAADEIASLRERLDRAKEALETALCECITMKGKNYICRRCLALRELESEGGEG